MPLPDKSALLWLGATGDKILPIELVSFLYEQIRKQTGLEVIPALGPADETVYRQLPEGLRQKTLVWSRPLRETAIFFAAFSLFVSADTGPMHLAVALGLPTLTIFRHSNPVQYGYQEPNRHISLIYRGRAEEREAIVQAFSQLGKVLNAR
jgi:ADP-heptose:LPS heptosyltransferase